MARADVSATTNGQAHETEWLYGQIAARLAELIDDVQRLWVERDEKRELLTLYVQSQEGTPHAARSLSDGTLRFLALAVLERDPQAQGLLCLEEPENGVHPERIQAMLRLLQDIATATDEPIGPDNPLRQVIINTHSSAVVSQVPDESVLVAELQDRVRGEQRFKRVCFTPPADTWRAKGQENGRAVPEGKLLAYINPVLPHPDPPPTKRRVIDRPALQQLLLFPPLSAPQ